jgi:tripartite-type tricarboxylate transporter receptor subunit TctC
MRKLTAIALACVALAGTMKGASAADAVADFYKGKTVTIAVGFSAGGGFDLWARLLARHMGRHIPGSPSMVVSNVPGAASLKAVLSLESTPKDGTQIVSFNAGLIPQSVTDPGEVPFRFNSVAFLGSITADTPLCYSWAATNIKSFDELRKGRTFNIGSTAVGTTAYIEGALLKNMFNAPLKLITGYPGSDEQKLAMERGELDGSCGSWDSIPRDWVEGKKFYTLVRYSKAQPKEMPPTPFILDMANDEQKKILTLILAINDIYRPFIVAKDIPADRLAALRTAFWDTLNDKAFVDEAIKSGRDIVGPAKSAEVEAMIAAIYAAPADVVKKASEAMK